MKSGEKEIKWKERINDLLRIMGANPDLIET
ncbi:hypothetical protein SAMN05192578_101593 [Sphingobacterium mizutaii]|nr:hypothetical protein SAMN05192578_101593 [Sphingobacterium mizutaii]